MPLSLEKKLTMPKKAMRGDLPSTAKEWVKYVNDLHDAGIANRRKWEFQWTLNVAYYLGYQNLIYNSRSGGIELQKQTARPLTINRIGSFIEARHSKLTKNRPIPRTIPMTSDREDTNAAKFADMSLMHLWHTIDMEEEYDTYVMLGLLTGTAFMKSVWNPYGGDYYTQLKGNESTGEIYMGPEGVEEEKIFMGEVSSRALSSFALIPANDSIVAIKDQPWIMERAWYSITELQKYYPHLKDEIQKTAREEKTEYEKIVDRLASPASAAVGSALHKLTDNINKEVLGKILWIKPNGEYPQGVVAVVIGKELAYIDVWPHDYGSNIYPYAKFSEKNDGFHFWGQSSIERLMSIQRAYNRLKQKKLKNAYLMANGKYLNPMGSQVPESSFTDEEGEVIPYNSSVPEPHQMAMAPLPAYVVELARELVIDFRDVGGQRESSYSPSPNLTAGVAMQVQAELADEIINPIIRRLGRSMQTTANQQLILMNEEYIEPRKVVILGEGNAMAVQWLSGADFRHHTDVRIDIESMFPEFRGAKRQMMFDLWDRRILTDPRQFLTALRFGNLDAIMNEFEKEEDPVYLDIALIKKGKEPEVTQFQNHAAYFKVLSTWIQSPEFLRLIPERKQLALAVLQAHMQFLLQSLPNQGQPMEETNQAAVGTATGGSERPVGAPGS